MKGHQYVWCLCCIQKSVMMFLCQQNITYYQPHLPYRIVVLRTNWGLDIWGQTATLSCLVERMHKIWLTEPAGGNSSIFKDGAVQSLKQFTSSLTRETPQLCSSFSQGCWAFPDIPFLRIPWGIWGSMLVSCFLSCVFQNTWFLILVAYFKLCLIEAQFLMWKNAKLLI